MITSRSYAETNVSKCTFKGRYSGEGELYRTYYLAIDSDMVSSKLTAEYNTFIDVGTGIWTRADSSIIRFNSFANCYDGIHFPIKMFQPSLNNDFSHNSFTDCFHGIYIDNRAVRTTSNNNTIEYNSFINNEIGILFRSSNSGYTFTLNGNTFENSSLHDIYTNP
jgi:nitrous oxidase accessory protein NosD